MSASNNKKLAVVLLKKVPKEGKCLFTVNSREAFLNLVADHLVDLRHSLQAVEIPYNHLLQNEKNQSAVEKCYKPEIDALNARIDFIHEIAEAVERWTSMDNISAITSQTEIGILLVLRPIKKPEFISSLEDNNYIQPSQKTILSFAVIIPESLCHNHFYQVKVKAKRSDELLRLMANPPSESREQLIKGLLEPNSALSRLIARARQKSEKLLRLSGALSYELAQAGVYIDPLDL